MFGVTPLDIALGGFWVCLGSTLLISLHRQTRTLKKLNTELHDSRTVLDECRAHLQMSNATIREVGTFTRMLTHVSTELRKPLDVIAQTAWVVKNQGAADTALMERYCDNILFETKRLGDTVDSMLRIVHEEAERAQESAKEVREWALVGITQRAGS
ncbi:MAG: hypothetical protein E4H03_01530 [Myxococcales bacterium]|jgi:hypothetical protein|nr:MAG: hypothetical protein E4H03_01530 [Myxococcales bacterium]